MLKESFAVKKITSDSKMLIESFEKESRHPIMNAILEEQEGGKSGKVLCQLGLKYSVHLNENRSFRCSTIGKKVSDLIPMGLQKEICHLRWLLAVVC